MHNFDRGMIKWQPFDSVIPSKQIVNEILKQKSRIKIPNLSDEQKKIIEDKLILAYYENEEITLDFYYQGKIIQIKETIKKIDSTYRKIYFKNNVLLFDQIIKIY